MRNWHDFYLAFCTWRGTDYLLGDSVDLDRNVCSTAKLLMFHSTLVVDGVSYGPIALWSSGVLLLVVLLYIIIGYKGLKMTSFNEDYAAVLGIAAGL